jgi:hypothetical protein
MLSDDYPMKGHARGTPRHNQGGKETKSNKVQSAYWRAAARDG